jgi:hypothetical protein
MQYKTATDFRKGLEKRLQAISLTSHEDLQRLRRKVAFDRLLARIFSEENSGFFLKGGYAMELRSVDARTTKDIDLTSTNQLNTILDRLQNLSRKDLHDYFVYRIGAPTRDLENAPYGGSRYPVTALIDNRLFVQFQLDIGVDLIVDRVETTKGSNWLEYCNISTPTIWMISAKQQFCEKLHAYTLPRGDRINSRSKDLIDMILLLSMYSFDPYDFPPILDRIFHARKTHDLPDYLDPPPQEWKIPFSSMAKECGLSLTMEESFTKVRDFYASLAISQPSHSG